MQKTFNIANELSVNRMGFGAMRITGDGIWGPPADRKEALRVLHRVVELGINFIDTADSYGPNVSEELIAEALYPYPPGLVIATKGGLTRTGPNQWPINAHPDHLARALEGSLKRLRLDQIDLYQLHRVDPAVPFERSLEFLQRAQLEGLIRHVGLSEVTVDQIKTARKFVDIVSVQNRYSVDDRNWEDELEYTSAHGIAFIPWYPIGGGRPDALARIEKIARRLDASAQQVALSWLLHHSDNILLIPGTSKVEHLQENVRAAALELTAEDMAELDKLRSEKISG
jgi:pyridoxine 4-dehydrogenase